jgi:hypothetical protein
MRQTPVRSPLTSLKRRHFRSAQRAAERDQSRATQHQPTDVPILSVLRILEAEVPLEPKASVFAARKTQPAGVHGFIQPLHAGGATGVTANLFGAFSGRARGAPVREAKGENDHQEQ